MLQELIFILRYFYQILTRYQFLSGSCFHHRRDGKMLEELNFDFHSNASSIFIVFLSCINSYGEITNLAVDRKNASSIIILRKKKAFKHFWFGLRLDDENTEELLLTSKIWKMRFQKKQFLKHSLGRQARTILKPGDRAIAELPSTFLTFLFFFYCSIRVIIFVRTEG